ncbi:MAG: hypothetical protein U1E65_35295 [Myxococcota bacterium]
MSKPINAEDRAQRAAELLVQLVRLLRVSTVHELENAAVEQVLAEVHRVILENFEVFDVLAIQVSGDHLYMNGDFIKLRGAAFEAAGQARRIYKRLGINEIAIKRNVTIAGLRTFLRHFQRAMGSPNPTSFAELKLDCGVQVRSLDDHHRIGIDQRVVLARAYAQLVVILQESVQLLGRNKPLPLARIRRAAQSVAQAAETNRALLAGLTRFDNSGADPALHAAAVGALSMLMGMELKLPRKPLMALTLSAIFHHIAAPAVAPAEAGLPSTESRHLEALATALALARSTPSAEVVERASIAFEAAQPAAGDRQGVIPSTAARCISVACAFDRLMFPGGGIKGVRPDHALRILTERSTQRFDRRVVRLFTSIVGLYPVGSLVRLSGGQVAVVLTAPSDPNLASRPTVRVIEEKGASVSYLVELEREPNLAIVESVDAQERRVNVAHFLLA